MSDRGRRPLIVVTVQAPEKAKDEELAWRKNDLYLGAIRRAGGEVAVLHETSTEADRQAAFDGMDGLLLTGGADLDPARYGQAPHPKTVVEPGRDALEDAAFTAAEDRRRPILGICRGIQAINVFRGGSLVQDLAGHTSPAYPSADARAHPLSVAPDSRLARILGDDEPLTQAVVNTYHHQALRSENLGRGLRVTGTAPHPDGELVEAVEDTDAGRWLIGVQSHPERTEFMSPDFERLWEAFVRAAREGAG